MKGLPGRGVRASELPLLLLCSPLLLLAGVHLWALGLLSRRVAGVPCIIAVLVLFPLQFVLLGAWRYPMLPGIVAALAGLVPLILFTGIIVPGSSLADHAGSRHIVYAHLTALVALVLLGSLAG